MGRSDLDILQDVAYELEDVAVALSDWGVKGQPQWSEVHKDATMKLFKVRGLLADKFGLKTRKMPEALR